ncbi:hypothetical protein [Streptomyces sp. HB132]|uniref:hypothetical protein n=1 Tax=Streptomyces sp. HB132 TaxID=767388 RepID=UPI00195F8FEF|nr:hypothetical protein [Streptomyces sp. HB132]MBM7442700.1 hypothetical protein [Streptomyces sp. HB132]
MTTEQVAGVDVLVHGLRRYVESLQVSAGDSVAVRRLMNDLDRLELDLGDLRLPQDAVPPQSPVERGVEVIRVPDAVGDPGQWHGVDDEGIGGHRRHHA